jgi:hypothetical protein
MEFEMEDNAPLSSMGYKFNDDSKSLSSLSSNCTNNSSFDSSMFEQEYTAPLSPIKGQRPSESSATVLVNDEFTSLLEKPKNSSGLISTTTNSTSPTNSDTSESCSEKNNTHQSSTSVKSDPCNTSFGLAEDDWTTQGNRTEKTTVTGGTFYTGYTDATGATKLHKNGVSAMLHRKLRRNNSYKDKVDSTTVPSSIKTIRRPMSFDNRITSNSTTDLKAPSQIERRVSYQGQKRIYTSSKLKGDPAARQIKDEWNCLFVQDDDSLRSRANETITENGDYHSGSKSFTGFIRSLFQCCNDTSVIV